jgi:archaellum component FlaC
MNTTPPRDWGIDEGTVNDFPSNVEIARQRMLDAINKFDDAVRDEENGIIDAMIGQKYIRIVSERGADGRMLIRLTAQRRGDESRRAA